MQDDILQRVQRDIEGVRSMRIQSELDGRRVEILLGDDGDIVSMGRCDEFGNEFVCYRRKRVCAWMLKLGLQENVDTFCGKQDECAMSMLN